MLGLLRQRVPEVQTLLSLRDRFSFPEHGRSKHEGADEGTSLVVGGDARRAAGGGDGCDKSIFMRWRLLSLLDRYALVIPGALAAAHFDFLKFIPNPPSERGTRPTQGGVGALSLLVQLATWRLLARDGVATGSPRGSAPSTTLRSGWLTHRAGGVKHTAAPVSETARMSAAENTPLGAILLSALEAPVPAVRQAARRLAVCVLQTLGIVSAGTPRQRPVSSECSVEVSDEGEAGMWLDLLQTATVPSLVALACKAHDAMHMVMLAGIRKAENGMSKFSFLRDGRGAEGGKGELDWDLEFR